MTHTQEKVIKLLLPLEILALILEELDLWTLLQFYSAVYKLHDLSREYKKDEVSIKDTVFYINHLKWQFNKQSYSLIIKYIQERLGKNPLKKTLNALSKAMQIDNSDADLFKICRFLLITPIYYRSLSNESSQKMIDYFNTLSLNFEKPPNFSLFCGYSFIIERYGLIENTEIARFLFLIFLIQFEIGSPSIKWLHRIPTTENSHLLLENTLFLKGILKTHAATGVVLSGPSPAGFPSKEVLESFVKTHQLEEFLYQWPLQKAPIVASSYLIFALLLHKCALFSEIPRVKEVPGFALG